MMPVIEQPPGSRLFILKVSIVAAFGGLLFGYDTAVIAGVIGFLKVKFSLSPAMLGWAASSAIVGCIFGALAAGYLSDRFGRKKILIVTAILFFISALGAAIPVNLTQFVIARFIGGLGIGAASMLSPLYISEIAPAKIRGTLVSLYQLAIVAGINLIYFVNLKIASLGDSTWNIDTGWRYMLASGALPALAFFILLFTVPESPRWLIKKNRTKQALVILEKINGEQIAGEIADEIESALAQETGRISDLLTPGMRKALIVGAILALFSQITGINAIIYFAPEIFKSIGIGAESAFMQTVIIGLINAVFTFVAIWLIDKAGRKTLLLYGVAGMAVCLTGIGLCFTYQVFSGPWLMIFILGYMACFASSLGPVPWVLISEIFPTKTRGIGVSFCTIVLWVGVLLITQFTPVLLAGIGGGPTFFIFMANSVILFVFVLKRIPETKLRTLEEIEKSWRQ